MFQTEKKPHSLHWVWNNIYVVHDPILQLMRKVRSVLDSTWIIALCYRKGARCRSI